MDIFNITLIVIAASAIIIIAAAYIKLNLDINFIKKKIIIESKLQNTVNALIDYDLYIMKPIEYGIAVLIAAAALFLIGIIFYRSIVLALLLTPLSFFYPKIRTKQIIEKRKRELKLQFKDALQSLSSSLHAGKSFELAMKSAISDLLIQYEADTYIIREFEIILRKLESNDTIERAFKEFAGRAGLEEIQSFAEILEICKRSGGNLITAIKSSTDIIADKIEVLNDISSILAEKKLEQNILSIMPLALILMLSVSAEDFMQPVFTEVIGRIVMSFSMILFVVAYFIAEKITNIEV
ncbi:MAG: Type secretion system domain [Clostridia bacterium]|nr:Type secretion system domain [Clostridia bacterium]